METDSALVISGVVAGAVQIVKLAGADRKWGMVWALALAFLACGLYAVSFEPAFERVLIWKYFTAVVVVAGAAVGIHSASKNTKEMVQDAAFKADVARFNGDGR